MNPKSKVVSLIYSLVLLGCALFAGFDTLAFAFGIGEGGGRVGLASGALLIGTLAGGVGLVIAALGSWGRWRGISLNALVSVLMVLPAAVLYGWGWVHAMWHNKHLEMHYPMYYPMHIHHYTAWESASAILPPVLGLVAAGLSWVRFRRP